MFPVPEFIGIHTRHKVAGADDEVKAGAVFTYKIMKVPIQMILKSQFHSYINTDTPFIFSLKCLQGREIGGDIQVEIRVAESRVIIMVVRDTDFLHAKFHGLFYLPAHRCV